MTLHQAIGIAHMDGAIAGTQIVTEALATNHPLSEARCGGVSWSTAAPPAVQDPWDREVGAQERRNVRLLVRRRKRLC